MSDEETLTLEVDEVVYDVSSPGAIDCNLRNCPPEHRDALLDARSLLYPSSAA